MARTVKIVERVQQVNVYERGTIVVSRQGLPSIVYRQDGQDAEGNPILTPVWYVPFEDETGTPPRLGGYITARTATTHQYSSNIDEALPAGAPSASAGTVDTAALNAAIATALANDVLPFAKPDGPGVDYDNLASGLQRQVAGSARADSVEVSGNTLTIYDNNGGQHDFDLTPLITSGVAGFAQVSTTQAAARSGFATKMGGNIRGVTGANGQIHITGENDQGNTVTNTITLGAGSGGTQAHTDAQIQALCGALVSTIPVLEYDATTNTLTYTKPLPDDGTITLSMLAKVLQAHLTFLMNRIKVTAAGSFNWRQVIADAATTSQIPVPPNIAGLRDLFTFGGDATATAAVLATDVYKLPVVGTTQLNDSNSIRVETGAEPFRISRGARWYNFSFGTPGDVSVSVRRESDTINPAAFDGSGHLWTADRLQQDARLPQNAEIGQSIIKTLNGWGAATPLTRQAVIDLVNQLRPNAYPGKSEVDALLEDAVEGRDRWQQSNTVNICQTRFANIAAIGVPSSQTYAATFSPDGPAVTRYTVFQVPSGDFERVGNDNLRMVSDENITDNYRAAGWVQLPDPTDTNNTYWTRQVNWPVGETFYVQYYSRIKFKPNKVANVLPDAADPGDNGSFLQADNGEFLWVKSAPVTIITQAQYDALAVKEAGRLYAIV